MGDVMSTFTKMYKSYEKILKLIDEEKSISLDEMSYLLKGLKETKYDNNKLSLIYSYLFKNKYMINCNIYCDIFNFSNSYKNFSPLVT